MRHKFQAAAGGTFGRLTFSTATAAWLAAVEAADHAADGLGPMEDNVYNAKGVWGDRRIPYGGQALQFIGARTLAGALVPAVGNAPTTVNLVDFDRFAITPNGVDSFVNTETTGAEVMTEGDNHVAFGIRPYTIPTTPSTWDRVIGAQGQLQVFVSATNQPGAFRGGFLGPGVLALAAAKWPRIGVMDGMVYMSRINDSTVRVRLLDESEDIANARTVAASVLTNKVGLGGFPFQPTTDIAAAPYTWYSIGTYIDPALLRQWELNALNTITAALA